MSGFNDFAPNLKKYNCFIVRNVTPDRKKTIRVFQHPIFYDQTRDLLQIPGVSESDIRASLLKGELRHKLLAKDITVECSDIDLLQFNDDQKQFLLEAGIIKGLEVTGGTATIPYLFRQNVILIGAINNSNRVFTVPAPDKFINGPLNGNIFKIQVFHNGRELIQPEDYLVVESGGSGTGYDTIILTSFTPRNKSTLVADYMIKAI